MEGGSMEMVVDNRNMRNKTGNKTRTTHDCAQNAGAEIAQMKKVTKKIKCKIKTKLVKGHPKRIGTRREDPIAHLTKQCDEVARKTTEQIAEQSNMTKINIVDVILCKIGKSSNQDR